MKLASQDEKIRGVIFCTSTMSVEYFLKQHILMLSNKYKIYVISDFKSREMDKSGFLGSGVEFIHLTVCRKISVVQDLFSLLKLWLILQRIKPVFIHTVTPKAGLLGMFLGLLICIPIRTHMFTGQVWANRRGFKKFALKFFDAVIALCSSHTMADSQSQLNFLVNERIVSRNKITTIGNGSIAGVDLNRFKPNLIERFELRDKIGVTDNSTVILFLGRLSRDKGLLDLARAYVQLIQKYPDIYLMIVGPDEDEIIGEINNIVGAEHGRVFFYPQTSCPEIYFASADLIALPSYREGFGTVIIEAAACGLPAVASNIYGISDAVVNNVTGLLHEPGEIDSMVYQFSKFLDNRELIVRMGASARERAANIFAMELVVNNFILYYDELLNFGNSNVKNK